MYRVCISFPEYALNFIVSCVCLRLGGMGPDTWDCCVWEGVCCVGVGRDRVGISDASSGGRANSSSARMAGSAASISGGVLRRLDSQSGQTEVSGG